MVSIANMYPNEELDIAVIEVGELDLIYFASSLYDAKRHYDIDTKQSFSECIVAAKRGNADANATVAHFYLNDTIIDRDRTLKAEAWAKKAVELGSAYGYWVLAWVLIEKRRPAEGVNAMETAAAMQFPSALYCMGLFYEEGVWVTADVIRARQCYADARKLGFGYASWAILNLYVSGKFGLGRFLFGIVARPFAHFRWMIWVVFSGMYTREKLSFGNYDRFKEMYA
jgi:TPR repeat protein